MLSKVSRLPSALIGKKIDAGCTLFLDRRRCKRSVHRYLAAVLALLELVPARGRGPGPVP